MKFNSFVCQNHFKILGDEALWKSWVLRNCDSAFPLSCPALKNYNQELVQKALIFFIYFFLLTSSNGGGRYFIELLGFTWPRSSFKLFSAPERGSSDFFPPLCEDLDVRYRMWPRRSHCSSSVWGRAVQFVCLLKDSLSWQCNFTTSLVCDAWVCHGLGVSCAWHRDLREGKRPQDSSCEAQWAIVGHLHLQSNHRTRGPGDWR